MPLKQIVSALLRRKGKAAFLLNLKPRSKLLDVGCGNNSPFEVKSILPNCEYTGIDVGDYNQSKPNLADRYIVTSSEEFSAEIDKFKNYFDAVVSAHNLEHCDDRQGTLKAMLSSLKSGGVIYIAFPCEQSVDFPSRQGTLNYFDDKTHKYLPPNFDELLNDFRAQGFEIVFSAKRYRPILLRIAGLFLEPISTATGKVLRGTWEYFGFESVIWARKQ